MHNSAWIGSVVSTLLAIGAGCSDGESDRRACPPKGIGVETFEGVPPEQQVIEFQQYDCSQPQICPDHNVLSPIGGLLPLYVLVPDCETTGDCPLPAQVNVILTNCSTGNQRLTLEKVTVYGDERCSFSEPPEIEDNTTEIDPGERIAVKVDWLPRDRGEDHGQLRIFSDAENFDPLIVSFCSRALFAEDLPQSTDAGATSADASTGGLLDLQCRSVEEVNSPCHNP